MFEQIITCFQEKDAELFNEENPDSENIYYQSYGFKMRNFSSDILLWLPNIVVKHFDGENDGLLDPESVK